MLSVNIGLETFFTLNYKTIMVLKIITVQLSVGFIFGGCKDCVHGWLQLMGYNPGTNLQLVVWHVFFALILSGNI